MALAELKKRRRSDYGFHLEYRTRWYEMIPFEQTQADYQ
jgi:hypothetical protein